ncbi:diguanylate cyclase (GGDEF) domain-containing protein [Variovorax sp. HW608]|uniref:diguanylate cyclase domain-containing protein n=1 Tax=Variovorax sp. HW608 TaxID=1034889 RepID=UPI00081FA446|nr:diguanylate cyclase [Variovorax sp. HW608]SCK51988.1 diguanylate cyclase (GGDEF) domain-containing protein [Variovorax sp. HW608]
MKKFPVEASLLLVDDDPSIIQVLSLILSDYSTLRFATSGADALQLSREATPDLILLDAQMGDMSGLQVCEALKADPALADVPVIFVSSHQESELEVAVLQLGAMDFIRKPFDAEQVLARVNTQLKLKRLSDDLRRLSRVDGLTGLANEAAHAETLARECARAAEARQAIALVLLEVDFFQSFEALYDRKATDACLAAVGDALCRSMRRPGDVAARIDRERFALVLPDTSADDALHVANRALRAVELLDISHQGSAVSRHVTCSAGVSSVDAARRDELAAAGVSAVDALGAAAAKALEMAVAAGRAQAALVAHEVLPAPAVDAG